MSFDINKVKQELDSAFTNNSEVELLATLKQNSFLFYELYTRKWGIEPNFSEISFGGELRCDFCWLNDNSDGPEWVLVEIEKPRMPLFTSKNEPRAELNHAIEQVHSWNRYFKNNSAEKNRILGAVSRFRYILVAGSREDWTTQNASIWRADRNQESYIEIRSTNVFYDALSHYEAYPSEFWSFEKTPGLFSSKQLQHN